MAKYHNQIENPNITNYIKEIVREALYFQQSEMCIKNIIEARAHPREWKYVRIGSHRRAGHTEAAKQLWLEYEPSLIITSRTEAARRLWWEIRKDHPNSDMEDLREGVISANVVNDRWFINRRDRYSLIILDACQPNSAWRNNMDLDEFRTRLYDCCDLLVELG